MSRPFLQTKNWAEFQQAFGRKIFWIDNKLVVKFDLPLGKSWLYCARVELKTENEKLKTFIKELTKIAKKENSIFAKIEPDLNSKFKFEICNEIQNSNVLNIKNSDIDLKLKIKNLKLFSVKTLQPQDELLLDISPSEEKLLAQMHQKTRYNIRLAQKKGLKIIESTDPKDIKYFYNLALETSQRNHFKYHSRRYYEKMIETFGQNSELKAKILTAFFDNQATASLIMLIYKDTAFYLHGASSDKYHNLMATFLLQWEAICRAKKMGCKWYNLGGISPIEQTPITNNQITNLAYRQAGKSQIPNLNNQTDANSNKLQATSYKLNSNHLWAGITRFKLGFAPLENPKNQSLHYPDAYDIVYQPGMYWIYKLVKWFKKITF